MKVRVFVDKERALRAGYDSEHYGYQVVEVKASELTQEQRDVLARYGTRPSGGGEGPAADFYLDRVDPYSSEVYVRTPDGGVKTTHAQLYGGVEKRLVHATPEAVKDFLTEMLARDAEQAALKAEWERAEAGERAERVRAYLDKTPDELVDEVREGHSRYSGGKRVTGPTYRVDRAFAEDAKSDDRLKLLLSSVRQVVDARNAAASAEFEAALVAAEREAAEEQAAKAAAERAKEEAIAAWVRDHGTPVQRAKYADGLFDPDEAKNAMRGEAFACMGAFRPYERLDADDLACECAYRDDVEFGAYDAGSLTDDEYRVLAAARKKAPAGATVKARVHEAKCKACEGVTERLSLHVTIPVGPFEFTREYALTDGEPEGVDFGEWVSRLERV